MKSSDNAWYVSVVCVWCWDIDVMLLYFSMSVKKADINAVKKKKIYVERKSMSLIEEEWLW